MKKTLLSLGILGILFLGTGNVFAAPMPKPQNPPRVEKHQQPAPQQFNRKVNQKTVIVQRHNPVPAPRRNVAPPPQPKHHVAPPPPQPVAHRPHNHIAYQPYTYNSGFALKIGNFFLSI